MTESTHWRRLWDEIDAAMDQLATSQGKVMTEFLKRVRVAVTRYGEEVDPSSFDDLGQPIEPKDED